MSQDACCAAVRRYLSRRIGENLVVAERPDRDLRNEAAVEEIWRSPSRGYVVEHTRVEAFEGQIQDDKAFMRFVGSLQDALSGHLSGRFAVAIPWGVASTSGIRFAEARTEVERLIKNNAEILRDGEAVELTSEQLPFSLCLLKRNSKDSLVFFSRWIEEPRWTVQIRPFMVTAKAAISRERSRPSQFYFTPFPVGKSAWTFVRQLRGPHFSTCA